MKAMVMKDIGVLECEDVPVPEIEPGGLLVRVESCALCATDIKLLEYGHAAIRYPHVLGHEIAGVVEKVSAEGAGVEPGDRVALAPTLSCGHCWLCDMGADTLCQDKKTFGYHWWGGFAEYVAVSPRAVEGDMVVPVPEGVPFDDAAVAEPLACAIHGQNEVDTHAGDTVVVIGLGPLGCMHIAVARGRGAAKIVAADIRPSRLDLAERFGADVYVNSAEEDLGEVVARETGGRGANVVIAATPAKPAVAQAVELVAPKGRVSLFGGLPKTDPVVGIDVNIVHYREASLHGSFSASPGDCRLAMDLLGSGRVDASSFITHRLPLSGVREGMELTKRGESLKIVIKPQQDKS
jgi:L-iditol 2-dehydrogenase